MNLLIVSATPFEVQPLLDALSAHFEKKTDHHFVKNGMEVRFLITGVGMTATAFSLGHVLATGGFQLAVNAGIAGAFNRTLKIGDVVQVVSEQFGDLGVEGQNGRFTDVFEMGLVESGQPPFQNGLLKNDNADQFDFLPKCKGLTVNKVHGSKGSIEAIQEKYEVEVESMEGAAFFYACILSGVPFLEIRSISNYVEPRNKENWDIPLAIKNLNQVLVEMIGALGQ